MQSITIQQPWKTGPNGEQFAVTYGLVSVDWFHAESEAWDRRDELMEHGFPNAKVKGAPCRAGVAGF